MKVVFW